MTTSPGFTVVLVQPLWLRKSGRSISMVHSSTLPLSVLDFNVQVGVRIGPFQSRYNALHRHRTGHVVQGQRVMRKGGRCGKYESV